MSPAARRVVRALLLLLVLLAGVAGVLLSRPAAPVSAATPTAERVLEPVRITATQQETFAFFNDGRAAPGSGRGLFETDFFKPAPAPPKPVAKPPAPPPPRNLAVIYRGLAAFPGGTSVAYVAVDGRLLTLSAGEAVAEGWTLLQFDSAQAVLARGEARFTLPFNRSSAVPVKAKP